MKSNLEYGRRYFVTNSPIDAIESLAVGKASQGSRCNAYGKNGLCRYPRSFSRDIFGYVESAKIVGNS